MTTTLIALISTAPASSQAIATACSYLFRSLGSVLGLAGLAATFQQLLRIRLEAQLKGEHDAETIIRRVRESLDSIDALPEDIREVVRNVYAKSINTTLVIMTAISAGALVASCTLHFCPLPQLLHVK